MPTTPVSAFFPRCKATEKRRVRTNSSMEAIAGMVGRMERTAGSSSKVATKGWKR
jgi:hypothetical protein